MNDGGSVFPVNEQWILDSCGNRHAVITGGITLRDYFAAKATEEDARRFMKYSKEKRDLDCTIEEGKFRYADAMLKAREAK